MLDRWVAGLIGYDGARRNYYTLLEIPKRLAEHATAMRARAEAEVDALVALEEAARDKTDIPALLESLKEARGAVEAIDAGIATLRTEARETGEKRASYERGEDAVYRQAVDAVVGVLDDQSIADLRRQARATRLPEDDAIVEKLVAIEDALEEIDHERAELKELSQRNEAKLDELEDLKVEFRRRRYDDYSSEFRDENLFGVLLTELLRGAITGAGLLGTYGSQPPPAHPQIAARFRIRQVPLSRTAELSRLARRRRFPGRAAASADGRAGSAPAAVSERCRVTKVCTNDDAGLEGRSGRLPDRTCLQPRSTRRGLYCGWPITCPTRPGAARW